jgi:hypothetical protein
MTIYKDLLGFFLPDGVLEYFEIMTFKKKAKQLRIYLEKRDNVPKKLRDKVKEITLDMEPSMNQIAMFCFTKANRVTDRFMSHSEIIRMRLIHKREKLILTILLSKSYKYPEQLQVPHP